MSMKNETSKVGENPVNRGRHEHQCRICAHTQRADIEEAFVNWDSLASIAKQHGVSRDAIYRHAHVFGLMDKRRRNVRTALERIIERAGEVDVTAAAVVAAVQAYSKINATGQWVERSEHVNLNELFERMTREEMETYAKEGTLPAGFEDAVGATATDSGETPNEQ
jgi:Zn-dependent peptidase ImmA (M78 family)